MSCTKISKVITLLFILFITTVSLQAQSLNGSPYSNYGLGDLNTFGFSGPASAGYTSSSLTSKRNFTFLNPASNGYMDFTIIKLGAVLKNVSQESGNLKGTYTEGDLSYIALGFPLLKSQFTKRKSIDTATKKEVLEKAPIKWGLSFGLTPFTNTAYGTNFNTDSSFGTFENIYNGEGGISRVFINNGIKIGKNFSIGHSSRFLFGSINDYRVYIFPDSLNIKGQQDHRRLALNGFQQTVGFMLNFNDSANWRNGKIKNKKKKASIYTHTLGGTFTFGSKINSNEQRLVQSMDYSNGNLILEDTLVFNEDLKTKVKLPQGFTAGYALQKENKWRVALEYKYENWSDFNPNNNNSPFSNSNFSNSNEYSIGLTLNPDASVESFKNIEVRLGLRHKESYLNFQELNGNFTNLTESGITFGLGIPLVGKYYGTEKRLHNMFDIGIEYYTRGKKESGLVKENYLNVTMGITFNDYWFKRRKIY